MDNWLIVFLVTIGYLLLSLMIGLFSGRRTSASTEGYVAGDRTLGTLVMYFIMGASIFSAFAFLGGPGWAYSRGAAAFYIIAYGTVGLIPWYFIGPRVARLGRKFGYVTQAELFAHRFESKWISILMALISLAAFLPYLTLQMQGAGIVFSVVTEGRIPIAGGAAIAYVVVLIYVFRSGVMGVAWTNTFQGFLMLAIAWGLGLYLPYKLHGGIGPMFEELERIAPTMLTAPGLDATKNPWSWGAFSSAIAISVLGFSVWPHYFMKIYTAQSVRTLKKTVVLYPTFQIFLVPIMFIGFAAIISFPGVDPADRILPTIVMSMDLPPLMVGLFCAGALAASMSSGDAMLHAASSVLVKDLIRVANPKISDRSQAWLIRVLVVVIGMIAYYFAVLSNMSLVLLLLMSYGAIAQIFPTLIAVFYWPRCTGAGATAGLIAGFGLTALFNIYPSLQWQQIHPGIWGVMANVFAMIVVSMLTNPMKEEHVRQFIEA